MKIREGNIKYLIARIDDILDDIQAEEHRNSDVLDSVSKTYVKSARNLIHYNALRKNDIRAIQKKLKNLGMSRLAKAGSHVKASLLSNKYILQSLLDMRPQKRAKG